MTIYELEGDVGGGKTCLLVAFLKDQYDAGKKIFYNGKLNFPYIKIDLDWLLDLVEKNTPIPDNMTIGIDEIAIGLMDSRISGSKINRVMSYLFLMSRKLHSDFCFSTQFEDLLDYRLLKLTKTRIHCEFMQIGEHCFSIINIRIREGKKIIKHKAVIYLNQYFSLYDTNEVIRIPTTTRYDKKPTQQDQSKLIKSKQQTTLSSIEGVKSFIEKHQQTIKGEIESLDKITRI
jgi:GTPase SAR1 family protein